MKNINWNTLVTRKTQLVTMYSVLNFDLFAKKYVGSITPVQLRYCDGTVQIGKQMQVALQNAVLAKLKQSKAYSMEIIAECKKACFNLLNASKSQNLPIYFKAMDEFTPFLFIVFPFEVIFTTRVKRGLEKELGLKGKNEIESAFNVATFTLEDSDVLKNQISLLKITIDQADNKDISNALKVHCKKFAYLGLSNDFLSEPWSIVDFQKHIAQMQYPEAQLSDILANKATLATQQNKLFSELSKKLCQEIKILQDFMFLRSYRIDAMKQSQNNIKPALAKTARQFELTLKQIVMLSPPEILNLINSRFINEAINRNDTYELTKINGIVRFSQEFKKEIISETVDTLTGMPVTAGKISGVAKIVLAPADFDKVREGDILITSMTTPDYLPVMNKAAAFVTDEGGILCHAAIVARELKKVCIVGTKIATKVFKDGDLVEVDAVDGLVRKL